MTQPDRLPSGRQPYDTLNGARVGALAGAIIGAATTLIGGPAWLIFPGAALGALGGYWYQRLRPDDGPSQPS